MGVGHLLPLQSAEVSWPPPPCDAETFKGNNMQRTPFIVLILLTMSAAARAATHDLGSFTGVGWVWMLGLSLYAVLGVIILGMCKSAAASDALEDQTYAATLKQAGTRQGLSHFEFARHRSPLDLA